MKNTRSSEIPVKPVAAPTTAARATAATLAPAAGIKVLLVDDHPVVRRGLSQILSEGDGFHNLRIHETKNVQEALDALWKEKWDVVVLDVTMPGRSGLDLLKEVRQTMPKLPVLVLSVHSEDEFAMRVLQNGASGYLTKGTAPQELVGAVKKLLSGGKYITSSVAEKLATNLHRDNEKARHETLSDREYQVMFMLASGKTIKEIGGELSLSIKTISTYRSRIMQKMGLRNNAELMRYALEYNLVDFHKRGLGGLDDEG